jgi:hypothetical protein
MRSDGFIFKSVFTQRDVLHIVASKPPYCLILLQIIPPEQYAFFCSIDADLAGTAFVSGAFTWPFSPEYFFWFFSQAAETAWTTPATYLSELLLKTPSGAFYSRRH